MVVKYNSLDKIESPVFTLCNPGSVYNNGTLTNVVGILSNHESEELIFNFNSSSELNFRIDSILSDNVSDNEHLKTMFNSVKNKRLIFMDDIGYFVIDDVKDSYENGIAYKDVSAKSVDVELQQRGVPYIPEGTYPFSTQGQTKGILQTVVETLPLWTIGVIDSSIANKYRTFDDIDPAQNCLGFLINEVQEAYECIILFDIINRTINVYDQSNYIRQTDVHITKHDLINSCKVTEQSDDLYTAITAIGDNDVVISAINPLGTNTIYNFNYYLDWMSDGLRAKVVSWQALVQSKLQVYYDKQLQYYTKKDQASNLEMDIRKIKTQLEMYEACYRNISTPDGLGYVKEYNEVIVANGGTPITIKPEIEQMQQQITTLINQCNTQKSSKEAQLANVIDNMSNLIADIDNIRTQVSFNHNFTPAELEELQNYIFEGNYKDEYVVITDEMTNAEAFNQMKVLYDRAKMQLDRVSQPTSEYEVDVESFIFAKEFEHAAGQLETGCLINVELDEGDVAELFLSNIKMNYQDYNFSLTFGNRYNKFDPKTLFNKVLGSVSKSANSISYIKDLLYPIKNGEVEKIYTAIKKSRDLTIASALASDNEEVIIDSSGYTGRSKNPDEVGGYDPEQIKITGKNIVFTDDRWETCKTAIGKLQIGSDPDDTAYGINAEVLMGDIIMGNELHILDNQGREIFTVVDGKIHSQIQDNNENYVDGHIADSANAVKTYADTQITQTADKITSEATARLEATVGYSGKNILELTTSSKTQNGITFTVNKTDGTITVSGTATAQAGISFPFDIPSGDYYFSGCPSGGSASTYDLYAYDSDYSESGGGRPRKWNGTTRSDSDFGGTSQEIKIVNGHRNNLIIRIQGGVTCNNIVFRPMIRIGSISDDTFEPYHSVQTQITETNSRIEQTADSITSEVSKKVRATVGYDDENLIDFSNRNSITTNGITYTVDKDNGIITADGTATDNAHCNITLPSTVYGNLYLTGCPDGGKVDGVNKYLVYIKDETADATVKKHDGTTISSYLHNEDESTEVQLIQGHTNRVRIIIYNGTTVNNLEFNPCVSKHKKVTTELSETNSRITQTADSITLQVNDNLNRAASSDAIEYKMPTDITINYYGYGLIDTATTDTGKKASDNNGKYYLDRKTGKVYKSNGSTWVENRTLSQKLDDYYTSSQANAAIEVSARGIKQTVGNSTSKYDTTGYNIDLYGLELPTAAGYPASEHNGKFYLNQSTGFVYKSNGTSWSKQNSTALPLISTQLGSKIDQTAESITSTVGKATNTYDTTGYTIHYYGFGFKKNDDGTINYAITDSGNKASGNNNKYFLDQSTGYLYKSNNSVWAEPNPNVHFTPITTNLNTKIEQTAESITQTVSATYTTKDESNKMLGKTASPNPVEYIMPTGVTIDYYGYGLKSSSTITDTGKKASEETDRRFLNRANGTVYKSNGTKWVKDTDISPNPLASKLNEAVTELNSSIVQTADSITSEVSKKIRANVGYDDENLLNLANTSSATTNGITFTVDKKKYSVTANGTATANASFNIPVSVIGNYYLSGCADGGGDNDNRKYFIYGYDGTTGVRAKKHDGTTPSDLLFDSVSGTEVQYIEGHDNRVRIVVYSGKTVDNVVFSPALTEHKKLTTAVSETNSRITQTDSQIRLDVSSTYSTKTEATNKANTAQANAISAAATDATTKANAAKNAAIADTDNKLRNYSTTTQMNQKADSISLEAKARIEATVGYSSKNLFEVTANTQTKNGITFTIDKTAGTIKVNGTATAQTQLSIEFNVPSGDYYFSGCPSGGSSSTYDLYAYDRDYSESGGGRPRKWDGTTASASDYGNTSQEIKIVGGHETVLTIRIQSGVTVSNKIFKPMIRKGTIADATFEPYRSVQTQFDETDTKITETNSKIDITTNGIMLSSAQMAYGKRTKNLIPFVLKSDTLNGITITRSGTGFKLTGVATSNAYFTLYTTDGSAIFDNSKLPNTKTLSEGTYIVSGEGFGSDIKYHIERGISSSNYTRLCSYSGETDGKLFTVETTLEQPYVRQYVWIRSGTDMGSNGTMIYPMIRDASIADDTYTEGIDTGAYMCSAINLTPEKLELDAGKLIINSDNFSLDVNGKCTLGGDSIIQSKNYVANSKGMKIQLSDGTIDSKNFKVSSNGTVTATGASITGGHFEVNTVGSDDDNSYILLKTEFNGTGSKTSRRLSLSPKEFIRQVSTYDTTGSSPVLMERGIISMSNSAELVVQDTFEGGLKPKVLINPYSIRLEFLNSQGSYTLIDPTRITTPTAYVDALDKISGKIIIKKNLSFASGVGIDMADKTIAQIYENTLSVGSTDAKLPLRLYGSTIWANKPITTASDARRKQNIEPLDNRYLDIIKSIEPKRFRYLSNPLDRFHTGYIAQDVQSAMKKLNISVDELSAFVDINGDGSDLALRYGEFIPLLHKWLKELDSRVSAIEKRKE